MGIKYEGYSAYISTPSMFLVASGGVPRRLPVFPGVWSVLELGCRGEGVFLE